MGRPDVLLPASGGGSKAHTSSSAGNSKQSKVGYSTHYRTQAADADLRSCCLVNSWH